MDTDQALTPCAAAIEKSEILRQLTCIFDASSAKGLSREFFENNKPALDYVSGFFEINHVQATLLAHFIGQSADVLVSKAAIGKSLRCVGLDLISLANDFDTLIMKKLIRTGYRGIGRIPEYLIPVELVKALSKGEHYQGANYGKISPQKQFDIIGELFHERAGDLLSYECLSQELAEIFKNSTHLLFSRSVNKLDLSQENLILFLIFCNLCVNQNEYSLSIVGDSKLSGIFDAASTRQIVGRQLQNGSSELIKLSLVEPCNDSGMVDGTSFQLTRQAKNDFLAELALLEPAAYKSSEIIPAKKISKKKLFYNPAEQNRIQELAALLKQNNFKKIQKRLVANGLRKGFACLFHGSPGTGKTETAYQIARQTGRDLMAVDISKTLSPWVGESEKLVKSLFDRYKAIAHKANRPPILLFNEADAVINKRTGLGENSRSVDKMYNAMQNIILQELETLDGILIATTNLTENMDNAFERRFIYKIEFSRPSAKIAARIWHSQLPFISPENITALAERYMFTGGQIENIARKSTVTSVLKGAFPSMDEIKNWCEEESLGRKEGSKIGF